MVSFHDQVAVGVDAPHRLVHLLGVQLDNYVGDGERRQFLSRVSQLEAGLGVHVDDGAGSIEDEESVPGILDQEPVALLAQPQSLFGLCPGLDFLLKPLVRRTEFPRPLLHLPVELFVCAFQLLEKGEVVETRDDQLDESLEHLGHRRQAAPGAVVGKEEDPRRDGATREGDEKHGVGNEGLPSEGEGEPALLTLLPGEQTDGVAERPGDIFRHLDRLPQFALVGKREVGARQLQPSPCEGAAETEGDVAENGYALESRRENTVAFILGVDRLGNETEEEHVLRPGDEKIVFPLEKPDLLLQFSQLPVGNDVLIHRSLPESPGLPPLSLPARLPG